MQAQLPGLLQEQVLLLVWQFSHRLPDRVPVAHARSDVPDMHEPVALQHPVGQLVAEHEPEPLLLPLDPPLLLPPLPLLLPPLPLLLLLDSHAPWWQRSPVVVQSSQAAPMVPHSVLEVELTHVVPLQQPVHVLGPQLPPPDPELDEPSPAVASLLPSSAAPPSP
jgi:hypothetical protein